MAKRERIRQQTWRLAATAVDGPDVVTLQLEGRIGQATANEFAGAARALLDQGARDVVLDFARVDYISSAGLRVIEALGRELAAREGRLTLCAAAGAVRLAFDLAGLTGIEQR